MRTDIPGYRGADDYGYHQTGPSGNEAALLAHVENLLDRLEAAELRATQIEVERNESEGREATLKGLLDRAWHRERKLRDAVRLLLTAVDAHDQWCGYNVGAPGNGILNRAVDAGRAALAEEDA